MSPSIAVWLSTANWPLVEQSLKCGFHDILFDLEHGIFDQTQVDALTGYVRARGARAWLKSAAPEPWAIMQALDRGASGVVVPQLRDLDHAREVAQYSKYPPLGRRGASGGRVFNYEGADKNFFDQQNQNCPCYLMIETAGALAEVEGIAALSTVDGLMVGPTDLALSRGRGSYLQLEADRNDIKRVARAAMSTGKPWIFPAWSATEQTWARELDADLIIVSNEFGAAARGLTEDYADAAARLTSS